MLSWVIRLLLLALILRLVTGVFRALAGMSGPGRPQTGPRLKRRSLVRDPVCGTYIEPAPGLSLRSGGGVHYFCSEDCRQAFRRTA